MAIAFPLTTLGLPKGFNNWRWINGHAQGSVPLAYDFKDYIYDFGGRIWAFEANIPPLYGRANYEPWFSWLTSLDGRIGTFLAGPPDGKAPRGIGTGTPLIAGANQVGRTINVDGFTASTTNILRVGDYLTINSYLYKNLLDVNSVGGGACTLEIWPALRSSPADNTPITVLNCTSIFRLLESFNPVDLVPQLMNGLTIRAAEDLP